MIFIYVYNDKGIVKCYVKKINCFCIDKIYSLNYFYMYEKYIVKNLF